MTAPLTSDAVVMDSAGSCRSVPSRRQRACWGALVVCLLASSSVGALGKQKKKVSRTVTGQVLDGAENPIMGASVELTDTQTGKKVAIYSEDGGRYQFADLNPTHDYQIQALNKNIPSDVRKVSSLDDRDKIIVNLRIPPAQP